MAMTNTITIKGCLGRDAEVRSTNAGRQVASCSLAHSQGKQKESMWLDLTAWENGDGPQGWAFRDLSSAKKGTYVTVTGSLSMITPSMSLMRIPRSPLVSQTLLPTTSMTPMSPSAPTTGSRWSGS